MKEGSATQPDNLALREVKISDEEGSPNQASQACIPSPGTSGRAPASGWSSLPDDMVKEILARLSQRDFARISMTCRSLRTAYWQQLPPQWAVHYQLAVQSFSYQQIACVCSAMVAFLKRNFLHPAFTTDKAGRWRYFWIPADGVLLGPVCSARNVPKKFGEIQMSVLATNTCHTDYRSSRVLVGVHGWKSHLLEVTLLRCRSSRYNCGVFDLLPRHDADFKPAAFMHALLSVGLVRFLRDYRPAKIRIGGPRAGGNVTQAGLKAQIVPLLPFASRYTPVKTTVGQARCAKECMRIGKVE